MRMKTFKKQTCRYRFKFKGNEKITARGGVVLIDALAREYSLPKKIAQMAALDPRKRKGAGFAPEALATQIIYGLCCGATSLKDIERIGRDRVWLGLVGLRQGADESTLGEWLRAQTAESLAALQQLNKDFVRWAMSKTKPGRLLSGGVLDVFFDDTEIEVHGCKIEGARWNYDNRLALSFQTLWTGPFVLDSQLGSPGDVSDMLVEMIQENGEAWAAHKSHFYADSASSAVEYLKSIEDDGQFTTWSVSYNKWTSKLDRMASELPAPAWTDAQAPAEYPTQFAYLKHRPGKADRDYVFAVRKQQRPDELLPRFGYVVGRSGGTDPELFMQKHQLKGACELGFKGLLSTLDLHHPPCLKLEANQAFYALAVLAHNLLQALKLIELDDSQQAMSLHSIVYNLICVPAALSTHANYRTATFCLAGDLLAWFRKHVMARFPRRRPGRPRDGT